MVLKLREKIAEELTINEYEQLTNVGIVQFLNKVN